MRGRARKLGQLRHIELGVGRLAPRANHANADTADALLQHDKGVAIGRGARILSSAS